MQIRWLGRSMALGALYDLLFGAAILLLPALAASWLGLALPQDPVYLKLNGIFLLLLAALYSLPAADPVRYRAVAWVAAAGRAAGFVYFARVAATGGESVFWLLGLGDLLFALLHLALLLSSREALRREASG